MLPIRIDPMRELSTLQREMDDLFRKFFGGGRPEVAGATLPAINTFIKDGMFHLEAELPGVDTDKLDVRVDGHDLVIHGERRVTRKDEKTDYLLQEMQENLFERRLTLPEGVNPDKAHAAYRNGLLEITMPVAKTGTTGRKLTIEGLKQGKESKEIH